MELTIKIKVKHVFCSRPEHNASDSLLGFYSKMIQIIIRKELNKWIGKVT